MYDIEKHCFLPGVLNDVNMNISKNIECNTTYSLSMLYKINHLFIRCYLFTYFFCDIQENLNLSGLHFSNTIWYFITLKKYGQDLAFNHLISVKYINIVFLLVLAL